jgi:hypothetical protein
LVIQKRPIRNYFVVLVAMAVQVEDRTDPPPQSAAIMFMMPIAMGMVMRMGVILVVMVSVWRVVDLVSAIV